MNRSETNRGFQVNKEYWKRGGRPGLEQCSTFNNNFILVYLNNSLGRNLKSHCTLHLLVTQRSFVWSTAGRLVLSDIQRAGSRLGDRVSVKSQDLDRRRKVSPVKPDDVIL